MVEQYNKCDGLWDSEEASAERNIAVAGRICMENQKTVQNDRERKGIVKYSLYRSTWVVLSPPLS